MTENRVFHLSNVAAGTEFDLTVADGADVLAAAQAHLEESGLYGGLQHGFYISVYPRDPAGDAPTSVDSTAGEPPAQDSSTADEVILA